MRVIVACERSGIIREAFRALGHDAYSCDLEPSEKPTTHHYQCDLFQVAHPKDFDLLIIHPECRYLTVSGIHWNSRRPERAKLTEQAVEFAGRCFELCSRFAGAALENPVSILSTRFRKPDQTIQPWQFGEDASKATCLWLFGLPRLVSTSIFPPRIVNGRKRWANQTDSGQNKLGPSNTRAMDRARTYQGIADAMAKQWGGPLPKA